MSKKIIQLNQNVIRSQHKELMRNNAEKTLNDLLGAEAEDPTPAA